MTSKAEALWEGRVWGKGGYISVSAVEMAGKMNNLSGLSGHSHARLKEHIPSGIGRTLENNMVRNLDFVPKMPI